MKISQAVIQNRNIQENTEDDFIATYKGKKIIISTDHGFGNSKYNYLKRFMIDVVDIKSGMKDVDSYQDFQDIRDAIKYALVGACLITNIKD